MWGGEVATAAACCLGGATSGPGRRGRGRWSARRRSQAAAPAAAGEGANRTRSLRTCSGSRPSPRCYPGTKRVLSAITRHCSPFGTQNKTMSRNGPAAVSCLIFTAANVRRRPKNARSCSVLFDIRRTRRVGNGGCSGYFPFNLRQPTRDISCRATLAESCCCSIR